MAKKDKELEQENNQPEIAPAPTSIPKAFVKDEILKSPNTYTANIEGRIFCVLGAEYGVVERLLGDGSTQKGYAMKKRGSVAELSEDDVFLPTGKNYFEDLSFTQARTLAHAGIIEYPREFKEQYFASLKRK